MPTVTMRQLLEAGVHFGHQTRRWNPKMRPFIFAERNGIHIIDLAQTVRRLEVALDFVRETVARGDSVLFVGTKKQAQEPVAEEASRAGMLYINHRWLGGFLTNFVTIKKRLALLEQLEAREAAGDFEWMTKKEASRVRDELERLRRTLGGVRKMKRLPGAIFVIDPQRERIAATEARQLEIPVVGTGDTNIDPDMLDYVIPANDDAIRAIRLLCRLVADACLQGAEERATRAEAVPEVEAEVEQAEAASDEYMAALAAGKAIIFEPGADEDEEEDYLSLAPALAGPAPRARTRPEVVEEEEGEEAAEAAAEPAGAAVTELAPEVSQAAAEAEVPAEPAPEVAPEPPAASAAEPPAEAMAEIAAEAAVAGADGQKPAPAKPRRQARKTASSGAEEPATRTTRRKIRKEPAEEQAEPSPVAEETVQEASQEASQEAGAAPSDGAKRRSRR